MASLESTAIVHKLRQLAADPDNQKFLIQETGCLTSLLYFLKSGELPLVLPALQTLSFLAAHPPNQPLLAKHRGLLPRLIDLADSETDENVQHFAAETLVKLSPYINNGPSKETPKKRNKAKSFKPRDLLQTQLIVAYRSIKECGEGIESVLLSVKGVVSVTMSKEDEMVTIYSTERLRFSHLKETLESIGVFAESTKKSKSNKYVKTYAAAKAGPAVSRFGVPQLDTRGPKVSALSPVEQMVLRNKSMVNFEEGFEMSTLAARRAKELKADEEKKQKKNSVTTFLGQLGSFWW